MKAFWSTVLIGFILVILMGFCRQPTLPLAIWAWERPERVSFLPTSTPIAYLAQTIYLNGEQLNTHLRQQPLIPPRKALLTAVIRIETHQPSLSASQVTQLSQQIVTFAKQRADEEIQIDFDARLNERPFYRTLLNLLHQNLPSQTRLSMTALASWCLYDHWLDGLPVAEAVPMVFRMGTDTDKVAEYLKTGQDFQSPLCRHSVGISLDEPIRNQIFHAARPGGTMAGRMIYVFNPHPWTIATWQQLEQEAHDAQ